MFKITTIPALAFIATIATWWPPAAADETAKSADAITIKATWADAQAITKQVMKECKLTRVQLLMVPGDAELTNWRNKTRAQYLNDPLEYERWAKAQAPCWTRERWQRMVVGTWANYDATGVNQPAAGTK